MSDITDQAVQLNRRAWDSFRWQRDEGLVQKHHDVVAELLTGKSCLSPEQRALAGDVAGKRLLDLGCGDGFELLEWARSGAQMVGVDNSPRQIAAAQQTAQQLGLPCELIVADILHLPEHLLQADFDLVFSAWVTSWIGDLSRWFHTVYSALKSALKPGGIFLLSSGHPVTSFVSEMQREDCWRDNYFAEGPFLEEVGTDSEWNSAGENLVTIEWSHTLGSIVTAAAQAGLHISHLIEAGDAQEKYNLPGYPKEFHLRAMKEQSRSLS